MSKNDIKLPPMPEWAVYQNVENAVRAYAIAAIKAYRKRRSEPEGWQLVPIEPTDEMKKAGCQVPLNKAARHNACYKAMLAAAPQPDQIPDAGKMVVSDRSMKEIKAALAGAKGKEHTLIFSAKEVRSLLNTIVNQNQRIERFEKKIADHIAQDRKCQLILRCLIGSIWGKRLEGLETQPQESCRKLNKRK